MEVAEKKLQKERSNLVQNGISSSMSYGEYRDLVHNLAKNRQTTGIDQLESLINYTELNDRRMNRWDKTLKVSPETETKISNNKKRLTLLVLSESWCGDASPSLPVMNKIAELNPNIELRILLRDENLELMDEFLTNGSRSIPKLIVLDRENEEIVGEWGPRSSIATEMAEAYKKEHGTLTSEFKQDLYLCYTKAEGLV